jgi:ribonuclease BN (tRNA processing enzyme)
MGTPPQAAEHVQPRQCAEMVHVQVRDEDLVELVERQPGRDVIRHRPLADVEHEIVAAWAGRWHKPLRVHGPSGRSPEYGTAHMVEGMKQMLTWHRDAFSVFPVGQGHDVDVTEFDFRDNGGVCYDENGVKIIHWQRSHAKDGASAYRLEWNGLKVVWTGDGRPSKLDAQFAAGADVYITETQPELCACPAR